MDVDIKALANDVKGLSADLMHFVSGEIRGHFEAEAIDAASRAILDASERINREELVRSVTAAIKAAAARVNTDFSKAREAP